MKIALKIDVETYRGTRYGVPNLVKSLLKHNAQASFFFALGPDRSGRGIFGKTPRVSLLRHYGLKTLLYGTLLPAPDIGNNLTDILCKVRDEGFEIGCYENVDWREHAKVKGAKWTRREMQSTLDRFSKVFGEAPKAHAASAWQMNRDAFRLTQRLGFDYASDTRGTHPFIPTWDAEIIACPQLPTTLPTLDEMIGHDGITLENVAQHLLALCMQSSQSGHVFTLRAELEGEKWLPIFEELLTGWKAQDYDIISLREYMESLHETLPRHEVKMGPVKGRSGLFAIQV